MLTVLKLSEIENMDRFEIASAINNVFDGRVPKNESEFKTIITPGKAEEIMSGYIPDYESMGYDITYNVHDLFVLYEEVMR